MCCAGRHTAACGDTRAQEGLRPTVDPEGHERTAAAGAQQGPRGGWELELGCVLLSGVWGGQCSGPACTRTRTQGCAHGPLCQP